MVRGVTALAFACVAGVEGARVSNSCGAQGVAGNETGVQIVNGVDAAECAWKWQVGFRYNDIGLPFCGGTLISDEWVLSAAHCGNFPDFLVVAGEWKPREKSGNEQNRRAVQFIRHPLYQSTNRQTHDYAMIRVDRAFDFNTCVGSACLPEGDDVPVGSECYITGWGTLRSGGSQPDILQEGKVTVLANNNCGDYTTGSIDASMLCAQGTNDNGGIVDACQGDSGGPLVCEAGGVWTLYGATSWGRGCAGANYAGVWARVHFVMDWVNQVIAENAGPPPPPPTRARCPDFASRPEPDGDGDCQCRGSQKCSTNGGASINCPSSGGAGAFGGRYFFPDCEECLCYFGI